MPMLRGIFSRSYLLNLEQSSLRSSALQKDRPPGSFRSASTVFYTTGVVNTPGQGALALGASLAKQQNFRAFCLLFFGRRSVV
jgi:hypothetical protein